MFADERVSTAERADRAPEKGGRLRFQLLGPLEIRTGEEAVRITADKQRTILAMLLVRVGSVVPTRSLIAEVWGDDPPRSAAPNLRSYIMSLRRSLASVGDRDGGDAPEALVTSPLGYLLRGDPDDCDLHLFRAAAGRGGRAAAEGDLLTADAQLDRALALWNGEAAEGVPLGPSLRDTVAELTEQ